MVVGAQCTAPLRQSRLTLIRRYMPISTPFGYEIDMNYDPYARTYDALYSFYDVDIPFYVEEAKKAGSPVLELACGTGRVTIPVAEAGLDVVGIDNSPAMLEQFRQRLPSLDPAVRDRITLHQADMRDFDLGDAVFQLVYCPFRAFLHLMTVEDQMAALNTIGSHLAPGGRFALNFFNPSVEIMSRSFAGQANLQRRIQEYEDPDTGNRVVVYALNKRDVVRQVIDETRIEEEVDQDGLVVKRTYKPLSLRWIYRYEFEHLLARCGFDVEALYGSFDRRPFEDDKAELVWIARKRQVGRKR
jgi:ubiquinone/menaquinone biosynthesis C-methylase UbiE